MKQSSPKKLTCPCFGTLTLTTDMPLYATTSNEERTCVFRGSVNLDCRMPSSILRIYLSSSVPSCFASRSTPTMDTWSNFTGSIERLAFG